MAVETVLAGFWELLRNVREEVFSFFSESCGRIRNRVIKNGLEYVCQRKEKHGQGGRMRLCKQEEWEDSV